MAAVERLERDLEAGRSELPTFTDDSFEDLISLSSDVRRLFDATTTTNEERKEIVRSLIDRVIVQAWSSGRIIIMRASCGRTRARIRRSRPWYLAGFPKGETLRLRRVIVVKAWTLIGHGPVGMRLLFVRPPSLWRQPCHTSRDLCARRRPLECSTP